MKLLVRVIVTGFGLAMGSALFKKHIASRLGLEEDGAKSKSDPLADGGTDPHLRERHC